jgi:hypothetical protein
MEKRHFDPAAAPGAIKCGGRKEVMLVVPRSVYGKETEETQEGCAGEG